MAGLFAVVRWGRDPRQADRASELELAQLLSRRPAGHWEEMRTAAVGNGAFAVIAAPTSQPVRPAMPSAASSALESLRIVDLGTAALAAAGGECAAAVAAGPAADVATALLRQARPPAPAFTAPLGLASCPHAALHWDGERLNLALDLLGAWPFYVRELPDGLAVGTAALPLALLSPVAALDPLGVVEMLAFGQLLGPRTLYAGVTALPPGARATFSATGASIERAELPLTPAPRRSLRTAADRIATAIAASVELSLTADDAPGLLLSGGLDSRFLLALLAARSPRVTATTFGQPGCADLVYARRAAEIAGVSHRFAPWTPDGLARTLVHCVALTDGHVPAIHFHGADILPALRAVATQQWNGFAGDAVLGGSFVHPRYGLPGPPSLLTRLFTVFNWILRPEELAQVLSPRAARDCAGHPRAALAAALAAVPAGPAPERARRFLLDQRVGRLAATGLAIDRHYLPVITPYVQGPVLAVMAELRLAERRFGRALAHALARHFPRLAAIPWQRTGAPVGTPWVVAAVMRSWQRLSARAGRRGGSALADYATWFDGPLRPLRHRLLTGAAIAAREPFAADALARLARAPVRTTRDAALSGVLLAIAAAAAMLDANASPPGELPPPGG